MRLTLSERPADRGAGLQTVATLSLATCSLCLSLPRGLMWFDAGELALASATWGLAHPPGQPFYTALGGLCYQLGGLLGLNVLSALSIVVMLASLRAIAALSLGRLSLRADLLGLLWCSLYPVWDQAARIELYATAGALGFAALYFAILSRVEQRSPAPALKAARRAGLLLGACGATNAVFAVAFGLSLLWAGRTRDLKRLRALCVMTLIGFTIPHLYLVWAARGSGGFVWGDLSSISGLWAYLSGADYRGTAHSAWGLALSHLLEWLMWSFETGAGLWCVLSAVIALTALPRQAWWGAPLVVLCGLFPLSYERYWPDVPDFTGYLLPIMGLSLLVMWRLEARLAQRSVTLSWGLTAGLLAAQLSAAPSYRASRATHHLPLTLAEQWLKSLPEGGALFVRSDHWVFPLMYLQEARQLRPDVLIFNVGFSRSGWYWRWLRHRHPTLPTVEGLGAGRLRALAARWSGPVYAEQLSLTAQLAPPPSQDSPSPLRFSAPPCPAGWGVSLGCERPLPDLDTEALKALSASQAPLSPITARVLAAHSLNLSLHYWSVGDARRALSLGYAALGEPLPSHATQAQWWPAPPQLWAQGGALLIGEPALARALLEILSKTPPRAPSPPP